MGGTSNLEDRAAWKQQAIFIESSLMHAKSGEKQLKFTNYYYKKWFDDC